MNITDIAIPQVYLESGDFRFFLKWFDLALSKIRYDTENVLDLFDPQRCPENLLWMLADTMGYKYDDRLSPAFCRLVLLYFMSMIKYKGSKSGVTLAAEVNLAQFNLQNYEKEKAILYNRLEDTSIPVNSVYVTAHTAEGFIDVVYFSEKVPIDACIEYVRPLGMYCFQHAGVSIQARTKISIDARLTNIYDYASGEGLTRVGHYSRNDYAKLQKMSKETKTKKTIGGRTVYEGPTVNAHDNRAKAWYRNSVYEESPQEDAGFRALSSLQMSNNEHIVKSLLGPMFDLRYDPQTVEVTERGPYHNKSADNRPKWNLRYNKSEEQKHGEDIFTISRDPNSSEYPRTIPSVNPIMVEIGDAMAMDDDNTKYTKYDIDTKTITIEDV